MALNCTTAPRKFPEIISCIIEDGYKPTQPKPLRFLGGRTIAQPMTLIAKALIQSSEDMGIFAYWWYEELQSGFLDFEITIPIFGVDYTFTAKMVNNFSEDRLSTQARTVEMVLEIQDDVGAIIASELSAQFCAIN